MSPAVSFVIPSHNCAEYLGAAVESVRNQTFKDLEIIVVDDASTDSTGKYLEWLKRVETRARTAGMGVRIGRSGARNFGNGMARGKHIFVLDADDICYPNRVELSLPLFKNAQFVHGGAMKIAPLNYEIGPMITEKFNLDRTRKDPLRQSFVVHSTVAYTREFAEKYQYSDGDAAKYGIDDWEQQMRAALDGVKFDFIPNYLAYYRDRSDNISNTRDASEVLGAKKALIPQLFPEKVA